jgi:hypothetical protein
MYRVLLNLTGSLDFDINPKPYLIIACCFQSKHQPVIVYGFTPWRKSNVLKENAHIPYVVYACLNLSQEKTNLGVRYLFHTCRFFRIVIHSMEQRCPPP